MIRNQRTRLPAAKELATVSEVFSGMFYIVAAIRDPGRPLFGILDPGSGSDRLLSRIRILQIREGKIKLAFYMQELVIIEDIFQTKFNFYCFSPDPGSGSATLRNTVWNMLFF
jgi:hypothetical protein